MNTTGPNVLVPANYTEFPDTEIVGALDAVTAALDASRQHTNQLKKVESGIRQARAADTAAAADAIAAGKPYPGTPNEDAARNELEALSRQTAAFQLHVARTKTKALATFRDRKPNAEADLAAMRERIDGEVLELVEQLANALDRRRNTQYLAGWVADDMARKGRKAPPLPVALSQGLAAIRDYVTESASTTHNGLTGPVVER